MAARLCCCIIVVFFFKQKTAYEMRISDWSSDVCSSDLFLGHLPALKADLTALENLDFLCGIHGRRRGQLPGNALGMVGLAGYEDSLARQLDRKSVVQGKSVSVRVDLVGRRIIKQTKISIYNTN